MISVQCISVHMLFYPHNKKYLTFFLKVDKVYIVLTAFSPVQVLWLISEKERVINAWLLRYDNA